MEGLQLKELVWESLVLVATGMIMLRISGRKSISQMTVAQTVVMISIGNIIIQPIIETSVIRTIIASAIFISFMIFMEYLQVRYNFVENLITGKAKIVIQDGEIVIDNLKKLRFTVDQLEMRLRQQGISNITDVKTATLEPNGQLGYELMRHAKPVTIGELEKLLGHLIQSNQSNPTDQSTTIFDEVRNFDTHEIQQSKKNNQQ